jgi:hypothetical protein
VAIITSLFLISALCVNTALQPSVLGNAFEERAAQVQSCAKLPSLLARSLVLAEKPGGLILTNSHCSIPLLPDDHEQQPLNVRLDALTESIPSLVWIDNAGVINLVPRDGIPELLKTKISALEVDLNKTTSFAASRMTTTEDFRSAAVRLGMTSGLQYGGLSSPTKPLPVKSIVFRDMTAFEILNELVRLKGKGIWLYSERETRSSTEFTLTFLYE